MTQQVFGEDAQRKRQRGESRQRGLCGGGAQAGVTMAHAVDVEVLHVRVGRILHGIGFPVGLFFCAVILRCAVCAARVTLARIGIMTFFACKKKPVLCDH